MTPKGYDLNYISLGAGVQSSALLIASALGLHGVPKADVAIFADTCDEPAYVYEWLAILEPWATAHGIPVHRVSKGSLTDWVVGRQRAGKRFVSVPIFTKSGLRTKGRLRRQCTREFKIEPIVRHVRELVGLKARARAHTKARRVQVRAMLGISMDEAHRMKPSREPWITNTFPLIEAGLTRRDCKRIITDAGFTVPGKSSCIYCPYHSDSYWREMRRHRPDEFARAVAFDGAIRDMTMRGRTQPGYLHRSLLPLAEVPFDDQETLDGFGNECEGVCGT